MDKFDIWLLMGFFDYVLGMIAGYGIAKGSEKKKNIRESK